MNRVLTFLWSYFCDPLKPLCPIITAAWFVSFSQTVPVRKKIQIWVMQKKKVNM